MNGSRLLALLLGCSLLAVLPFEVRGQFSTPKLVEEIDPRAKQLPGSPREVLPAVQPPSQPRDAGRAPSEPDGINGEPTFIPGRASAANPQELPGPPSPSVGGKPDAGTESGPAASAGSGDDHAHSPGLAGGVKGGDTSQGKTLLMPPGDGDAQLLAAWKARLEALDNRSFRVAEEQESRLLALRDELGYENLFILASAIAHESQAMLQSDPVEAKRRALFATALAPDLPYAHWMVARTSWKEDPLSFNQYVGASRRAFEASLREPRWRSALFADAIAALLGAFLLGSVLALLLVFARHLRCLLHDFRHLFPSGATRAQTVLILLLAACLPTALGLGAFGLISAVVAGAWLYMIRCERIVFGALVGLLGLLPMGASVLASEAAFMGTRAEALYLLERGGLEGPALRAELVALAEQPNPPFHVAFAIGRQARRRGDVQLAIDWLRRAAEQRPTSPEALTELGNALLLFGDLDGARDTYERAAQLAPERGEPFFNLARLFARKSQLVPAEDASYELGHSQEYVRKTIAVDARLGMVAAGEIDYRANRFLAAMPLGIEALAEFAREDVRPERLKDEVARRLFGRLPPPLAPVVSLVVTGLLGLLALIGGAFRASARCTKCGRPACRRCDVEVIGPGLCGQCVYIFNQRGVVDPTARAEKELGILRHQKLRERTIKLLSLLLPGSGLVLLGRTLLGTLTLITVCLLALPLSHGTGLVPVPVGQAPVLLKAMAAAVGLLVWALSVRSAFKAFKGPATKAPVVKAVAAKG